MEYVPAATFLLVLTVNTVFPAFTIEVGLNLPVANFGKPLTENSTVPEKPLDEIATEYVAAPSGLIVAVAGATEIVKSPLTTSVTLTVRVTGPLVPVITSG